MSPLRLGSRYELEDQIGEGALGVVWRGSDIETGAAYAIKLLRPEHAKDPATVARFVRERTALLRFRHPNVVVLHDMIVEGDRLALVMDLIADGDLTAHRKRRGGTLAPAEATELMAQICAALAAAHAAGIVHRDLKPANILLDHGQVRLTDFGIAQVAGEPALTTEGVFIGTLHYLAPEVIRGDEPTAACDAYAAGVTLYELLTGHPPFTGVAASIMHGHLYLMPDRPDGIPDDVWQTVAACMDKDPAGRPAAADLERTLRGDTWAPTATGGWQADALVAAWDAQTVIRPAAAAAGLGLATTGVATPGVTALAAAPVRDAFTPVVSARPAATGQGTSGADGTGGAGGPGGPGGPLRRPGHGRFRAAVWGGGALAALAAAGIIALALNHTPATPTAGPGAAVTVTDKVTPPGQQASGGRSPGAASSAPGAQTGAAAPGTSASTQQGRKPSATPSGSSAPTGTASPSAVPTGTASPSASASPSPSVSGTGSPSVSPSVSASPSSPADTAWHCGASAPATLAATGNDTGQTLQACIRVHNGKVALHGVLDGTVKLWKEQIVLVLVDSAGNESGTYFSPVCTTVTCTFNVTVVPARGKWTVLPEWTRYSNGNIQSTGDEPPNPVNF